jgi:hypothetical protein
LVNLCALVLFALASWVSVAAFAQADSESDATPTATASMTITVTPSNDAAITQMMTAQAPLEIRFEGVYSIALEFRAPLRAALEANRALLPELSYTVSAYRDVPGWAKITLVPTQFVEDVWANVEQITPVEVIMRQVARQWQGYLVGSAAFARVLDDVPRDFVDYASPLPLIETSYKFPWQSGQEWWAIQGWHDGNALDFQPGLAGRFAVLAAQAGVLRELCSDGTQSLLQIQHGDRRSTYYLHVTMGLTVRRTLLDQIVRQGQYLGELVRGRAFISPCGQGLSRHLHFAVSDRSISIEGFPLEGVAASASCCNHPPSYRSSNVRVDESREP